MKINEQQLHVLLETCRDTITKIGEAPALLSYTQQQRIAVYNEVVSTAGTVPQEVEKPQPIEIIEKPQDECFCEGDCNK